ncbi:MAG: gamma-glutamyl-gamma-aminobutyrate hydrolase family protein [Magnetovibrio sp.]|nr:gamma-glutamyl-gamma-aminobutyrate hydrolase family protein [Magnetovibrio sp.]
MTKTKTKINLITPVIGIVLDTESGGEGQYSKFPWYAVRRNYITSVANAGGLPLLLPVEMDLLHIYQDDIDGLLIPGGNFDVHPSLYGEDGVHESVTTKDARTQFEMEILQGALDRDMPVLGICGGQQLLHVALGGSLVQHVPEQFPDSTIAHEQPNPRDEVGHDVDIVEGTLLREIIGNNHIQVNSAHHQAVQGEPHGVKINARAPDGVVEGIEALNMSFCLGVQWHPEFEITDADTRIFAAFIEAARDYTVRCEEIDD